MTTSTGIPLGRVPHLWSADVNALREMGIESAEDLVQSANENGLKRLSDSSGIPPQPLQEYLAAAEALVSEEKTRRGARHLLAFALSVIAVLSVSMLTVQAGLLPQSAAKAENAYADLYRQYAEADEVNYQDLLQKVTAALADLEGEADPSRVNLLLLSSALNFRIAIAELEGAGDDPATTDYGARFENHSAYFEKARDEQALIESIREDDPRIAFVRVNAAQAWTSRATELGTIDLSQLPPDDPRRMRVEAEIRNAHFHALREISQTQNTPNIAPQLFAQRIDDVRNELDYQRPQRLDVSESPTVSLEEQISSMQDDVTAMQADIEDVQARIAELQSPLAGLLQQMSEQGNTVGARVDDAHVATRKHIDGVELNLSKKLNEIEEIVTDPDVIVAGGQCGLMDPERAKEIIKRQCYPSRGMSRAAAFQLSVFPTADGGTRIEVEPGQSGNVLDCDLERVMADFTYDNQARQCRLIFQAE